MLKNCSFFVSILLLISMRVQSKGIFEQNSSYFNRAFQNLNRTISNSSLLKSDLEKKGQNAVGVFFYLNFASIANQNKSKFI